MWISSSSSSSVVFLYTGLSKFMLLVFFRFQFLQMRYPPMHSKPMTTKERWKEGLLASLCGVCGSAGLFPNTYPPWDNFVAARLLLPSSAVLNSFPPPPWESEECIYGSIWYCLQRLNHISLPTGMTIPITAAVTVESKPWSLFASVITEMVLIT